MGRGVRSGGPSEPRSPHLPGHGSPADPPGAGGDASDGSPWEACAGEPVPGGDHDRVHVVDRDLSGARLPDLHLTGSLVERCGLDRADLRGARLTESRVTTGTAQSLQLAVANLRDVAVTAAASVPWIPMGRRSTGCASAAAGSAT